MNHGHRRRSKYSQYIIVAVVVLFNLIGPPYIVRLFWVFIHTFLVEPLFFLESLSEKTFEKLLKKTEPRDLFTQELPPNECRCENYW